VIDRKGLFYAKRCHSGYFKEMSQNHPDLIHPSMPHPEEVLQPVASATSGAMDFILL